MDILLQRHCAKHIYVIPEGLRELMSDISREVLRSQPNDIYTFIADYLDALMITRENARVAAKTLASLEEAAIITANLLINDNLTLEEADKAALIIQTAFRDYLNRTYPESEFGEIETEEALVSALLIQLKVPVEALNAAAAIIQRAYREFKIRKQNERKLLTGMIDWRDAARSTIALYRKAGVTEEEANRAATLIKAAYKGYYTRRLMKRLLEEGEKMYIEVDADVEGTDVEEEEERIPSTDNYDTHCETVEEILKKCFTPEQLDNVEKIIDNVVYIQRAFRRYLQRSGKAVLLQKTSVTSEILEPSLGPYNTTEATDYEPQKPEEQGDTPRQSEISEAAQRAISIMNIAIARVIPDDSQPNETTADEETRSASIGARPEETSLTREETVEQNAFQQEVEDVTESNIKEDEVVQEFEQFSATDDDNTNITDSVRPQTDLEDQTDVTDTAVTESAPTADTDGYTTSPDVTDFTTDDEEQ